MRIGPQLIPPNIRRLLPADHPQSSANDAKRVEKKEARIESEMHETFINWCRLNGVDFIRAATHRKSTIEEGWPDFSLAYNPDGAKFARSCFVEFKMPGNLLSTAQVRVIDRMKLRRIPVLVTTSVMTAIEWTKEKLGV